MSAAVEAAPRPRSRRVLRIVAFSIALIVLVPMTLRGKLPSGPQVLTALSGTDLVWVLVGIGMQALSMAGFALQQKALLGALGVRVSFGRATAVTLARSAISISLPAGAAVSAAYALRHYRRAGATNEIAAATMVVSGLVSLGGLAALYVVGVLVTFVQDPTSIGSEPPAALALTAAVLGLMLIGLIAAAVASIRRRRNPTERPMEVVSASGGRWARLAASMWAAVRNAWRAGSSLRIRDWVVALAYAAENWLTDLLCLDACTRALGLPIGITTLASIYLVVQIVRQVPITPGGVGLIETAFIAGLTAAGTGAAAATAAVLLYRLMSCWVIIPIGGLSALILNRVPDPEAAAPTVTAPTEAAAVSALDRNIVVQRQNRDVVPGRFGGERHGSGSEPGRDDVGVMAG
jgi:uncharacterized protein (TIRG00374 family)